MVNVDEAIIARLKKQGHTFEILVDCEKALSFKEGKNLPLDEVIATNEIYSDVKKGERASDNLMSKLFGTTEKAKIIEVIIKQGEIQLTVEHQAKIRELKRRQLITLIARDAVDPKTGTPHPPQRIESALDEAGVRIDYNKSIESQIKDVVRKLATVLPIKFELREIRVRIPAVYAGKVYGFLKKQKVIKEEWLGDGSLAVILEVPAGLQEKLEDSINNITKGESEIKVVRSI